jgi:hypothetical protein
VLAPTGGFVRRMRLSVDYYDIKVKNVIGEYRRAVASRTLCRRQPNVVRADHA